MFRKPQHGLSLLPPGIEPFPGGRTGCILNQGTLPRGGSGGGWGREASWEEGLKYRNVSFAILA